MKNMKEKEYLREENDQGADKCKAHCWVQVQTLMPGDLISLGTSVGAGPMSSGQRIDIEISGLPTLSNTFMDHPKAKL